MLKEEWWILEEEWWILEPHSNQPQTHLFQYAAEGQLYTFENIFWDQWSHGPIHWQSLIRF